MQLLMIMKKIKELRSEDHVNLEIVLALQENKVVTKKDEEQELEFLVVIIVWEEAMEALEITNLNKDLLQQLLQQRLASNRI